MRRAAEAAVAWAADSPLILGGDFNVRPSQTRLFEELAEDSASARRPAPIPSTTSWAEGSRR